jgi:hypothetical protein
MAGEDVAEKKVTILGFYAVFSGKTDMIFLFGLHTFLVKQM